MNSKAFLVAGINSRNLKLAYIITGIVMLSTVIQDIVYAILAQYGKYPGAYSSNVGTGNYLYLFVLLSAIFIPALNFRKMMNLGGKRNDFFKGSFVCYIIMTASVSLASLVLYYTYDRFMIRFYSGRLNLLDTFGWAGHGPVIAFFQQFMFLLLLAAFVHTLVCMQDRWYGWATDAVIVAIISVFTPLATFRAVLVRFFNLIIFGNPYLQIVSCLILAIVFYVLSKPVLNRTKI